jgi:hypothetical protein
MAIFGEVVYIFDPPPLVKLAMSKNNMTINSLPKTLVTSHLMCIAHKHKRCGQINYHTPIIDLLAFGRVGPFPAAKCDKHSCSPIKTLNPKFTHIEAI